MQDTIQLQTASKGMLLCEFANIRYNSERDMHPLNVPLANSNPLDAADLLLN